jgi:hypothetical protein
MLAVAISRKSRGGTLRNRALAIFVASLIVLLSMLAYSPWVRADSTLVQQSSGACGEFCTLSASFADNVASGDMVVVGISVYGASVSSVSDTLDSSFTQAGSACSMPVCTYIYYASLASSGPDTVTVTMSTEYIQSAIYI